MAFTPDGERLVTLQGNEVQIWCVATGELERIWRMPTRVGRLLTFSADSKTLAVVRDVPLREVAVWLLNLHTGETVAQRRDEPRGPEASPR